MHHGGSHGYSHLGRSRAGREPLGTMIFARLLRQRFAVNTGHTFRWEPAVDMGPTFSTEGNPTAERKPLAERSGTGRVECFDSRAAG